MVPNAPPSVLVNVRALRPYHYGVWCSVGGGEPFNNTICTIRWSEDGKHLWLGLESHNTVKCSPDEDIEVIPTTRMHPYTRDKYANWVLPAPPQPLCLLEGAKP